MDNEKSHVWLLRFNISMKVPSPNRKSMRDAIGPRSQRNYKQQFKNGRNKTNTKLDIEGTVKKLKRKRE